MEKHHKFSVWYVLLGIWVVLLIQNYIGSALAIKTIPYSQFLALLKENKVTEVAITQNQIQGKLIPNGSETGKTRMFKTVRVDPEISKLLEQYEKALEILRGKKGVLQKGAQLLMDKEKIEGDELKALMGETSPGTDEP